MTRTTSKGLLVWKIVRFDFDQGIVTLAGGETLKGLLCCIGNNVFQKTKEGIYHHQVDVHYKEIHHQKVDNTFEHEYLKCCTLDWAVWRGVYRAGPMETMLTSAFLDEDDCMVLKSLTNFFLAWKDKDLCRCCAASDLGTAFRECRGSIIPDSSWKVSSKERCALSHLQSVNKDVRQQGLRSLLDLLLDVVRDSNVLGSQKSTLNTSRKSTKSTPISSRSSIDVENTPSYFHQSIDSKKEAYLEEKENVSLLSGLMAVMDRPSKKKESKFDKRFIGSQTERALQVAQLKWNRFEEMKSDRSSTIGNKLYVKSRHALKWQEVLEWVDNGFLEILLKESIGPILEDGQPSFMLVEDLADACLQVIKIMPGEGTRRIVNCLVSRLQNLVEVFATLKVGTPQQIGSMKEVEIQQKMTKLRISFEEMVCFCRLLALIISSSVSVCSSLADVDGLSLILGLYSNMMKEFPVDVNNLDLLDCNISSKVIPGEVFGLKKHPPKVSKSHGSRKLGAPWLKRQEGIKSKRRLPLQEVSMSSRISHAFSTINSKVSNVHLEDNLQSDTPILYFQSHVSQINAPFSNTKVDAVSGTYLYPRPLSATIVDIVWEAKIHLLQTLVTMLESQSVILNKRKEELKAKLLIGSINSELLSWFISDLIGGPSNAFSSYVDDKLNKIIFKIIYLLDKDVEDNDTHHKCLSLGTQSNVQYVEEGPWWSGPGPPASQIPQMRLLGLMLVELKGRMDYIISCLMVTLPRHVSRDDQMLANCKDITGKNAKEHISSLWIDLARLSMVLSNFIRYWPAEGPKSYNVMRCCGGHFNQSLTLLASLGPIASWAPAQILAMQSLLKLLGLCIQDSTSGDLIENWSEYENFLWKMVVDTWAHWNCIQSYVSWLILEVCQGCLIHLLDEFQRSLHEPIQLYYHALGEQLGMGRDFDIVFPDFQLSELLPKKAMMFLRLVVILVQRKLHTNHDIHDGSAYLCFRDNALWFLQEIMNPTHGLLMMAIKNRPLGTCADCKIEITNPNHASEFCSSIEQHSLVLLAQIFSLKLPHSKVYFKGKCSGGYKNIFLSKKYLVPFLHTLYSGFKNLYTRVIWQSGLNSLGTLQGIHSLDDGKKCPIIDHSLESTTQNNNAMCSAMDEILSLCYSYAHVLLAAAKNLSEDGNQTFKDLRIMDFLVQEISLEYEYSQIAGPKSNSNSKEDMSTSSTNMNLQRPSSQKDLEIFKELEGSNANSSSLRVDCTLSSLIEEYELKTSTLKYQDFIIPQIKDKHVANVQNLVLSHEESKVNKKSKNKRLSNSKNFNKRKIPAPKDESFINKDNILKTSPINFSCNSIHEPVNSHSKIDSDDLKTWENEYTKKKKVVYSGRFFDLNEEVERELAVEEEDGVVDDKKQRLIEKIKFTSGQIQDQSKNIGKASISLNSSRSTSCESTGEVISTSLNAQPLVPKLDFTSALQKSQSNLANGFDIETSHNDIEENTFNNKDIGCKSLDLYISYDKEQLQRSIYHSPELHILLLELLISLMLNSEYVFIIDLF